MTRFENGPALGKILQLRREPLFLRVVVAPSGDVDALDQLDDKPASDEKLFAYRKSSRDGTIHINSRDRKTGRRTGGFFPLSSYALVGAQPDDATLRDGSKWAAWCVAEKARMDALMPPNASES